MSKTKKKRTIWTVNKIGTRSPKKKKKNKESPKKFAVGGQTKKKRGGGEATAEKKKNKKKTTCNIDGREGVTNNCFSKEHTTGRNKHRLGGPKNNGRDTSGGKNFQHRGNYEAVWAGRGGPTHN